LHGWPYDIHTFAEVSPLPAAGYRVIVPYLRGYGRTRFQSDEAFPQRAAVGPGGRHRRVDGRRRDREGGRGRRRLGARAAGVVAALWPERCAGLVPVNGYLIGSQQVGERPLEPEAERQW
jgi:pimeloyl-ACP methyl ester carboxylesterase